MPSTLLLSKNLKMNTQRSFIKIVWILFFSIIFTSPQSNAASIRFKVGGLKFSGTATVLNATISVDTLTPAVITGPIADQTFRDDFIGAAYFGYYLTAAVKTASQPAGTVGNIKLRVGAGATANRTFYLLGNGTTAPAAQSQLIAAPTTYTTFASIPRNKTRCGPNWSANGVNGGGINCSANPTVPNMDITHFIKVMFTDLPSSTIVSNIEFVVVEE